MKTVNGDVYRSLLLSYSHLCELVEAKAERIEREASEIEDAHETSQGNSQTGEGVAVASQIQKEKAR